MPRRLYLFVFVLNFSRITFARFTTSMRQPELLSCTREAFDAWGVPKELLVDNMKTAVDRHLVGEEVRFNASFVSFCEHFGSLDLNAKDPLHALESIQHVTIDLGNTTSLDRPSTPSAEQASILAALKTETAPTVRA